MTDSFDRLGVEAPISWSAIFAGGLVAIASSVCLTILASGFGYDLAASALGSRRSLGAFTPELGAGAIAIQVVSVGLGGYLAGRLRHAWTSAHGDEAHFRDTAHGLIVWAMATIAGLILAAIVMAPYLETLLPAAVAAPATDPARAAHIAVQSAFFAGVGLLLSAFIAAVAARIGGLHTEHMHLKGR